VEPRPRVELGTYALRILGISRFARIVVNDIAPFVADASSG
jgi:hypothetical protein